MTLYVTEAQALTTNPDGLKAPALQTPAVTTQAITPGASTANSAAFNAATRFIRVHTDAAVQIDIGAAPNAANGWRLAANQTEIYGVNPAHLLAHRTTT